MDSRVCGLPELSLFGDDDDAHNKKKAGEAVLRGDNALTARYILCVPSYLITGISSLKDPGSSSRRVSVSQAILGARHC